MKHSNLRHLSVLFISKVVTLTELGSVIENVWINMTTILMKQKGKVRSLVKKIFHHVLESKSDFSWQRKDNYNARNRDNIYIYEMKKKNIFYERKKIPVFHQYLYNTPLYYVADFFFYRLIFTEKL